MGYISGSVIITDFKGKSISVMIKVCPLLVVYNKAHRILLSVCGEYYPYHIINTLESLTLSHIEWLNMLNRSVMLMYLVQRCFCIHGFQAFLELNPESQRSFLPDKNFRSFNGLMLHMLYT